MSILAVVFGLVLANISLLFAVAARRSMQPLRRLATGTLVEGELVSARKCKDAAGRVVAAAYSEVSYTCMPSGEDRTSRDIHKGWEIDELLIKKGDGQYTIDLDHVIIVGRTRSTTFPRMQFEEAYPERFAAAVATLQGDEQIDYFTVAQRVIPEGSIGFVVGEVVPDERLAPGDGYRDAKEAFRVNGTDEKPIVLSAWPQKATRKYFQQPVIALAILAATSALAAAVMLALPIFVSI